jgi:hypothetical protein
VLNLFNGSFEMIPGTQHREPPQAVIAKA